MLTDTHNQLVKHQPSGLGPTKPAAFSATYLSVIFTGQHGHIKDRYEQR